MKAEDLSDIYRALGRLIEYIKAYKEMDIDYKVYYLTRIENQCRAIIFHGSFKASVFSEYMERLNRESFYINGIAGRIKEILDLGLVNIVHNSLEELNKVCATEESVRAEIKMWCDMKKIDGLPIVDAMVTESKEILNIYNFVFPNSRADNTEANEKEPEELTEREIKYYGKAIKTGMAKKIKDGYKWLYNKGSTASLAYFLYKLFDQDGRGQIPFKRLAKLWGVNRLDSALGQALGRKYEQSWRTQIDNLFTE